MNRKVYMDNGSTSFPKAPGVGKAMSDFIEKVGCNISRGGYETAYETSAVIYQTREHLAELFNFPKPSNVVFTANVTHSINYVIKGFLKKGDHVIISGMEHNAVARPCEQMKAQGVEVSVAPCDKEGELKYDEFTKLFKDNTALVVILHASNVCGTVMDAERIGAICKSKGVPFVLDSAQSAGAIPIDFQKMNLSALCVTGHKGLLGPQGIGALLMTDEFALKLDSLLSGGTGSKSDSLDMPDFLPDKFEAGTLNLPGIIGLNTAVKFILDKGVDTIRNDELECAERFINKVSQIDGVRIIGKKGRTGRTAVVSLDFQGVDNADVSFVLDSEFGIMTRCALHCAPLAHKTLGTYPRGTVRFAFGYSTTFEEVDYTVDAIRRIMQDAK